MSHIVKRQCRMQSLNYLPFGPLLKVYKFLSLTFPLESVLPNLQSFSKGQSDLHTVTKLPSLRLIITKRQLKAFGMRFKGCSIFTSWAALLLLSTFLPAKGLSWALLLLRKPCFLYPSSNYPLPQMFIPLPFLLCPDFLLSIPTLLCAVITLLQFSTHPRPSKDAMPYPLTEFHFLQSLWYFFRPTALFLFLASHSSTGSAPLCCTLGTRSCVPACQNFSAYLEFHQPCNGYR